MASKSYVVLLLVVLLASCAQVGTITGGPKDTVAPKPIEGEMRPANATTNYSGNTFEIPFDEYFKLNNPAQTIRMVPPHATIMAEMKKKTLYLSWNDTLDANTTYAIYLNGTVKDLNEGNDTTLQLVFSTGDVIDSITYAVAVVDAFTGDPLSDVTVALFDPNTEKLKSFGKSSNGIAELNYLSPGTYQMVAFEDENLDLKVQPEERVGFPEGGNIVVDSSFFDSIPIRTFLPFPKQRYKVTSFVPPGAFSLEGSSSFDFYGLNHVRVNGKKADFFRNQTNDAYFVISPDTLGGTFAEISFSYRTDSTDVEDTLTYRFRNNESEKPVQMKPSHAAGVKPGQLLTYELYSPIIGWCDSLIEIMTEKDSLLVSAYSISTQGHQLFVDLGSSVSGSVRLTFQAGAVQTPFGPSQLFTETITQNQEDDYGTILLTISGYNAPLVLEVMKGSKVTQRLAVDDPAQPQYLQLLEPGTYSFRIIRDTNQNELWDLGSLETLTQPEKVDIYSKPIKVRANWEIEVTLNPIESE